MVFGTHHDGSAIGDEDAVASISRIALAIDRNHESTLDDVIVLIVVLRPLIGIVIDDQQTRCV